ncbi:hypothetical protein ES705_05019 [subsurface metagenome]
MYIYQDTNWPDFIWDDKSLLIPLSKVRNLQGKLIGKMEAIGFSLREEAMLETLTIDIVKSNEIEGEILDSNQVRSSIARRLGMDISGLIPSDRDVEGVVEMMLDATQKYDQPLTKERLCNWHAALFPTGRRGMHKITVADWRKDETGPMQVISGPMGKEKVHYQAPSAAVVEKEISRFINWFNNENNMEPVLISGLAHLWFITIHPFDDGNGRIARAIADMQLARADKTNQRFYSMSAQIERQKKAYYDILEKTQKGSMDVTGWLQWFFECLIGALEATEVTLAKVLTKAKFWEKHATTIINERQKLMINKLLDNFFGKLNTSKWAKITKCSQDTALRDIQDLIGKEILLKELGGGRSTSYVLNIDI